MRNKAIDYVRNRSRKERNDYHRLMICLKNRCGVKEDPSVVRQYLNDIKQEFNESLEDFADRVQHVVAMEYKGAGDTALEKWAAELFLKGASSVSSRDIADLQTNVYHWIGCSRGQSLTITRRLFVLTVILI